MPACAAFEADASRREAIRFIPEPDRARLITVATRMMEEDGYSVTVHGEPDDIFSRLAGTPPKYWVLDASKSTTTTEMKRNSQLPLWQLALGLGPTVTRVSTQYIQALIEPKPGGFEIQANANPDEPVAVMQSPDGSSPPSLTYLDWNLLFPMRLKAALADHRLDAPALKPAAPSASVPARLSPPQRQPSRSPQLYGNPKPDALLDP